MDLPANEICCKGCEGIMWKLENIQLQLKHILKITKKLAFLNVSEAQIYFAGWLLHLQSDRWLLWKFCCDDHGPGGVGGGDDSVR